MLRQRIIIYSKDIQLLTGKSDRASRTLLQKIRIKIGKGKDQAITIQEFCEYLGLSEEKVMQILT
ncbi:MAG: hypothetical protein WCO28_08195 [Bacteroidota bacterium]